MMLPARTMMPQAALLYAGTDLLGSFLGTVDASEQSSQQHFQQLLVALRCSALRVRLAAVRSNQGHKDW